MTALNRALAGLKVVDLGRGMAAALCAHLLTEMGASVRRFERYLGDPFYAMYPAYRVWHRGADIRIVDSFDEAEVHHALADADVCIFGGEDHPDMKEDGAAETLAARYPNLVILKLQGFVDGIEESDVPAVELLVQARSGMCFEQYGDRPIQMSFSPGSYGAAIHGLTALFAGLCQRESDGIGQIVRSSLQEGMLTLAAGTWFSASRADGAFNYVMPKSPRPLIFRCRDGRYIHFAFGSFGAKGRVYRLLGINDPSVGPDDSGMPTGKGDSKNFYGDIDLLAAHVAGFDSDDLVAKIQAADVPVSHVMTPGECWDDRQVQSSGVVTTDTDGSRHVGLPMRGQLSSAHLADRPSPQATKGALPLEGMRIIDFGVFLAGPFGNTALADLGAEVIKVEALQGDVTRHMFRTFASTNRGKRAIAIDLKKPEGMEIATRLCRSASIVHSNFRPGVSARLGVDSKTLLAADPNKIVLETSGWGRTGPYSERPGFDMIFQAFCGHEVRGGGHSNPPMCDRSVMVDYFTGSLSALATMAAVWCRARGQGGADLELSLLDAALFLLSELVQMPDGRFEGASPLNVAQTGFHPAEAIYACRDGWIALAARGDAMAAVLAGVIGFSAGPRVAWGAAETAAISEYLASRDLSTAQRALEEAGVWSVPCNPVGERLLEHAGAHSDGLVFAWEHPVYGTVRQLGCLFRLGRGRHTALRGMPSLGADTRELLLELGYSPKQIESFYERRLVA